MRVLCVGSMYPPHHLGGYELVWQAAVDDLRARGHDVRVLASDHREAVAAGVSDSPDVHRDLRWYWRDHVFPKLGPRARLSLERHNAETFDGHVDDFRPDVVSWWAMGGMSLSLLERARRRGLPGVAFVNDAWLIYGPLVDAWIRFATRPGVSADLLERVSGLPARFDPDACAHFVFASEDTRRASLERWPITDSEVAHGGIDAAFLDGRVPPAAWGWRLLYVGRIDPRKGIATAIRALALLPVDARLRVVGGGDEAHLAELRALADGLGLADRVSFDGPRPRDELPAVYAAADGVVFPVEWAEPWGLVPLEAMACGRPVVATGTGGSAEFLCDGENSLLYAPGDAAALAERIERLAADEALRERLRGGGLATARAHTDHAFHARVEAVLAEAAGVCVVGVPGGAGGRGGAAVLGEDRGPAGIASLTLDGAARFYALAPLSRSLADGVVAVSAYDPQTGGLGPALERSFAAIDLDLWMRSALDAIELVLGATVVRDLDGRTATLDLDGGRGETTGAAMHDTVAAIEQAKRAIAGALRDRVVEILDAAGPAPDRLAAARDALHERMLHSLDHAYATDALVQFPVLVLTQFTDDGPTEPTDGLGAERLGDPGAASPLPPRVSGEIVAGDTAGQPTPSFSAAEVSVADGRQFLNSLMRAGPGTDAAGLLLELSYVSGAAEPAVGSTTGAEPAGTDRATLDLGKVCVPIALRRYPQPVAVARQDAVAATPDPQTVVAAKQWRLETELEHASSAQDDLSIRVAFGAVAWPTGGPGSGSGSGDHGLFTALARFHAVWPDLQLALAEDSDEAALTTFGTLVEGLAGALMSHDDGADASAGPAWPADGVAGYTFRLGPPVDAVDAGHGPTLELTAVAADDAAIPWPSITVSGGVGRLGSDMPTPASPPSRRYHYPPGTVSGLAPPAGMFDFPGTPTSCAEESPLYRDGVRWSSGRVAVGVRRNAGLVAGRPTAAAFVYNVSWTGPAAPAELRLTAEIGQPVGTGRDLAAPLAGALTALLTDAGGPIGGDFAIGLRCEYRGPVVAPDGADGGAFDLRPVFVVPHVEFSFAEIPSFAERAGAQAARWLADQEPAVGSGAAFVLSLELWRDHDRDPRRPLIALRGLRVELG